LVEGFDLKPVNPGGEIRYIVAEGTLGKIKVPEPTGDSSARHVSAEEFMAHSKLTKFFDCNLEAVVVIADHGRWFVSELSKLLPVNSNTGLKPFVFGCDGAVKVDSMKKYLKDARNMGLEAPNLSFRRFDPEVLSKVIVAHDGSCIGLATLQDKPETKFSELGSDEVWQCMELIQNTGSKSAFEFDPRSEAATQARLTKGRFTNPVPRPGAAGPHL